jgi:hypothetical protein
MEFFFFYGERYLHYSYMAFHIQLADFDCCAEFKSRIRRQSVAERDTTLMGNLKFTIQKVVASVV